MIHLLLCSLLSFLDTVTMFILMMVLLNSLTRRKSNFQHSLSKSNLVSTSFDSPPSYSQQRFGTSAKSHVDMVPPSTKELHLMSLFKRCSTLRELEQIHSYVLRSGLHENHFLIGQIVVFCAGSDHGDDMDYAASVFEMVKTPDGFLWNYMIRGVGRTSFPERAFVYYRRMQEFGHWADNFTFCFLLKISAQFGLVSMGKQLHCSALKHGLGAHDFVGNTLVHMYGGFRDIEAAREVFDEIPSSDVGVVAWNAVIDAYVCCGKCREAFDLFSRMLRNGIDPDEATLVSVISACTPLGALDFGRWVHSCIKSTSLTSMGTVHNALIDMYAKCGDVEKACEMFEIMEVRSIVSWNTIISALAMHGNAAEALRFFSKMEREDVKPDGVTFLGVLGACSHGGMVKEARRYFNMMSMVYGIKPSIKHYGCMVDVLARAGLLEEAYHLIMSMPMKCNVIIWRTILAACKMHGDIELGEKVRAHLLELEPDHSSDYILLASIYASVGRWRDAAKVRKSMHNYQVRKPEPGNSLAETVPGSRVDKEPPEILNLVKQKVSKMILPFYKV